MRGPRAPGPRPTSAELRIVSGAPSRADAEELALDSRAREAGRLLEGPPIAVSDVSWLDPSYRRAAELLVAQTGWTLHQFRHSALTHLAEDNVQLPLLMAESRHRSLRTLQRYARPGPDAVAALTATHDPGRRR